MSKQSATSNPKYLRDIAMIPQVGETERETLKQVSEKFVFRTNEYYQSLIDWSDPEDPIRRIVMPDRAELNEWGRLDASDEGAYTVAPGCEHKYPSTALLLVNDVCGAYCRFCFRKRLFMDGNDEVSRDVSQGLEYIRNHRRITNVLLTGGDPLILSTRRLESIISQLREIRHVRIIRIGSKMPAFNPFRILNDPSLLEMFAKYSTNNRTIYIMAHFNHPRELTPEAVAAMNELQRAGVTTVNQTPIIRGINDKAETLEALFRKLSFIGVPPYYVFQCRPTLGNEPYAIPLEEAFYSFETARMTCSGLAKRARFVMSHATGKIEVVGKTEDHIFMRYHQAAEREDNGRFMVFPSDPCAYWFDDYQTPVEDARVEPEFQIN